MSLIVHRATKCAQHLSTTSSLHPFIGNEDLSDSDQHIEALAYKEAVKKVYPVAASLPKDFCIIWCQPEDPLLTLPTLPSSHQAHG